MLPSCPPVAPSSLPGASSTPATAAATTPSINALDEQQVVATSSSTTPTIHRGNAAFTALSKLDMFTPSMILALIYKNNRISCTISGFVASHPIIDEALQTRVQANMQTLQQDILGAAVESSVLIKIAMRIGHLRTKDGNSAIIPSRLVHVVMALFDFGSVDNVAVEIRRAEVGLVTIGIRGLKWRDLSKFSLECCRGFKESFTKDGKMTAAEQRYYDEMPPMVGLEDIFDDDEEDGDGDVHLPIDATLSVTSDESLRRDSLMEDSPQPPPCSNSDYARKRADPDLPSISDLKEARTTNDWTSVTKKSLRAFLDHGGEHRTWHTPKASLVVVAAAILDQKYATDEEGGEESWEEADDEEESGEEEDGEIEDAMEQQVETRSGFILKLKNPDFPMKKKKIVKHVHWEDGGESTDVDE
ncbi:uncharacterized protein RCC_08840 [Ramularia collo-cygni]|uniref:Uncharacterized protein n=1 Tax=Ramularia collo-cygni TaxID=112498 RepID=A0A2D3V888_9PEZI|nr:uncharacterized protein RCC_08840 [Ramularia collo-cygni]CZT23130.1 uncharacterized protein RCC_08840 [Ramularia collo-cygni]